VDFEARGQILIIDSAFVICLRKMGIQRSLASVLYKLQKTYVSVRKEVFYNTLVEFVISIHLARLLKMSLDKK